jgi:Flp pilus assembly protein TadG
MRQVQVDFIRRLLSETRGAEIAEAAAVLPLMFMILLGIFWFGQAFSIYGAITRAAQEGARAGSVPYCASCGGSQDTLTQYATNASNAVSNALTASKLDPTQASYPNPQPVFTSCSSAAVTCTAGGSTAYCVQIPVQLTTPTGTTGPCGIAVSFRYPFTFWLPFTSLNKKPIYMTAHARMRLESR